MVVQGSEVCDERLNTSIALSLQSLSLALHRVDLCTTSTATAILLPRSGHPSPSTSGTSFLWSHSRCSATALVLAMHFNRASRLTDITLAVHNPISFVHFSFFLFSSHPTTPHPHLPVWYRRPQFPCPPRPLHLPIWYSGTYCTTPSLSPSFSLLRLLTWGTRLAQEQSWMPARSCRPSEPIKRTSTNRTNSRESDSNYE